MVDKMGCISLAKRLSTLFFQNGEQVTTEEEPAVTEHDREDIGAHRLARQDHSFIRSHPTCQSELGVFQLQIDELINIFSKSVVVSWIGTAFRKHNSACNLRGHKIHNNRFDKQKTAHKIDKAKERKFQVRGRI